MTISAETVVLITGASSGIGSALALDFARFGAKIALVARRKDRLEHIAEQVRQAGGTPLVISSDISRKDEAERAVRETLEKFGTIDILVNNAGRGNCASVEDTPHEQLESIFALNVFALWYLTAPVLPVMKAKRSGHIINIASVAGKMAFPFNSAYVAAKHACVGFTAALRTELVETGVNATVICPDGVVTEWAGVTEGGSIGDIFGKGIPYSRTIARERGIPLAPLAKMISAEEASNVILQTILSPEQSDVFTHSGSYELALEAASDRRKLEEKMLPLYLGMRKGYEDVRGKS